LTGRRYKLISYLEEGADEAYDMVRDRGETHVLAEPHGAYEGRKTLRNWQESTRALPSPALEPPQAGTPATAPGETSPPPTAPPPSVEGKPEKDEEEEQLEMPKDIEEQLRSLGYVD
jgi:hypothetical protein